MSIHIGHKIKEIFYQKPIKVNDFASKINKSRNVVYNIFERATIDTGLLKQISEALEHDFFQYYAIEDSENNVIREPAEPYISKRKRLDLEEKMEKLHKELQECKKEVEQLKKEMEYLKIINELLEKKQLNIYVDN